MFCIVLLMLLIDVLAIGLVVISVVHEILVFNIYLIFFLLVNQSRPGPIVKRYRWMVFEKRLEFHAEFCVTYK